MTLMSGKRVALDPACADAVDVARSALAEIADDAAVGQHLGVEPESERVAIHYFDSALPGYQGWRWAVTVMRASRSRTVTIGETVLLPGADALLPPAWVPWTERLRPGDLGIGDLLPTDEDDARLEPGWNASDMVTGDDDDAGRDIAVELDLVRPRVLSPIGLDDAVDRWVSGEHGPGAPMAQAAPATCASCGFRIALRGPLGAAFGVCANEISPSDGHVVTLDHGCGAHSEAVVIPAMAERLEPVIDEVGFEVVLVEADSAVSEPDSGEPDSGEPDVSEPDAGDDPAAREPGAD